MADMLVNLYDLPDCDDLIKRLEDEGINIRRAMAPDLYGILDYVGKNFGTNWKGECTVCFAHQPISCFVAEKAGSFWVSRAMIPPCAISSAPRPLTSPAGEREWELRFCFQACGPCVTKAMPMP